MRVRLFRAVAVVVAVAVVTAAGAFSGGTAAGVLRARGEKTGRVWMLVSGGVWHTCGIRTDHSLWCWGWNQYGQLGTGVEGGNSWEPVRVGSGSDWTDVSAGAGHTCGIRTDGTLWCWGGNESGELGLGDTTDRPDPTQVGSGTDWRSVTTGSSYVGDDYTCGTRSDDTLWCWGGNQYGQLGLGDTTERLLPTRIGDGGWLLVSTGWAHTCAVSTGHALWCWGANTSGQLGVGDKSGRLVPTRAGAGTDWNQVSASYLHTCGIRADHTLWCWGEGSEGRLGLGRPGDRVVPRRVGALSDWRQVKVGRYYHSCAVRTDRTLWCWGWNYDGALGHGDRTTRSVPTRVEGSSWQQVTAGLQHSCGIRTDHSLWCWGDNSYGQLGLSQDHGHRHLTPKQV